MTTDLCSLGPIVIRLARVSSFAAPIVGFSSILLSIAYSPWFRWEKNALSDLGVSGAPALLFSLGIFVAGMLTITFGLGLLAKFSDLRLGQAGAGALTLDGGFLSSIGPFPETGGTIHL